MENKEQLATSIINLLSTHYPGVFETDMWNDEYIEKVAYCLARVLLKYINQVIVIYTIKSDYDDYDEKIVKYITGDKFNDVVDCTPTISKLKIEFNVMGEEQTARLTAELPIKLKLPDSAHIEISKDGTCEGKSIPSFACSDEDVRFIYGAFGEMYGEGCGWDYFDRFGIPVAFKGVTSEKADKK
jgi:hypothetical protein